MAQRWNTGWWSPGDALPDGWEARQVILLSDLFFALCFLLFGLHFFRKLVRCMSVSCRQFPEMNPLLALSDFFYDI